MNPTLVLLAAGMSTRYGRLKQLEPVGPSGEALLDYAVFDGVRAGFHRVVLVIREELEDRFRDHIQGRWPEDLDVVFHHQRIHDLSGLHGSLGLQDRAAIADVSKTPDPRGRDEASEDRISLTSLFRTREKPWGTAHALLTARRHLTGPFVVLNADDFYGEEAFLLARGFLNRDGLVRKSMERDKPDPTFALVTYTLEDTLSDHGGVSRGVCRVDGEGWLRGIEEVLEIREGEEGLEGRTVAGRGRHLTGSEPISTNFWVFTPEVFPLLEEELVDFLEGALRARPSAQPEFLIPTVVNHALEAGDARVRSLPTSARFLGITHLQDRGSVVEGLEAMTAEGLYPEPLWTNG